MRVGGKWEPAKGMMGDFTRANMRQGEGEENWGASNHSHVQAFTVQYVRPLESIDSASC